VLLLLANLALQHPSARPPDLLKRAHTYSIVAYDSATGDLGVAVQSKFPNVGGIVPWARSGVGAVATQSLGNTDYGEKGLALMALGTTAPEVMGIVMRGEPRPAQRQVGMVVIAGRGFAAQANIMVSDQTVKNMAETFERTTGTLADRLMAALVAGQAGGGDRRGMESAALLVVRKNAGYLGLNDRYIDIRVYDDTNPLRELARLYQLHQLYFFTTRPEDLLPLTPAVVRRLEPVLLREPLNQPEKWLDAPQGVANQRFLNALANFMYWENYDVRVRMDGKIDKVVLDDIFARRKP